MLVRSIWCAACGLLAACLIAMLFVSGAQAQPESVEATVVAVESGDRLVVVGPDGGAFKVQYVGLRAPLRSSHQAETAAAFHAGLTVGKRVRLETDGPAEQGGYRLRHAFLEGRQHPVGAEIVAAGWARAVPYPRQHTFRALYLELQEQALAEQRNLWQDGVLGPALVWRPAGSAGGYIAADPALIPILETLQSVPAGARLLVEVTELAPLYRHRELSDGTFGSANAYGLAVDLSSALVGADPRGAAAALAHESVHLLGYAQTGSGQPAVSCFETELRAHATMAEIWGLFFGPRGVPNPQTPHERSLNSTLQAAQSGDLAPHVRLDTRYQRQCAGES